MSELSAYTYDFANGTIEEDLNFPGVVFAIDNNVEITVDSIGGTPVCKIAGADTIHKHQSSDGKVTFRVTPVFKYISNTFDGGTHPIPGGSLALNAHVSDSSLFTEPYLKESLYLQRFLGDVASKGYSVNYSSACAETHAIYNIFGYNTGDEGGGQYEYIPLAAPANVPTLFFSDAPMSSHNYSAGLLHHETFCTYVALETMTVTSTKMANGLYPSVTLTITGASIGDSMPLSTTYTKDKTLTITNEMFASSSSPGSYICNIGDVPLVTGGFLFDATNYYAYDGVDSSIFDGTAYAFFDGLGHGIQKQLSYENDSVADYNNMLGLENVTTGNWQPEVPSYSVTDAEADKFVQLNSDATSKFYQVNSAKTKCAVPLSFASQVSETIAGSGTYRAAGFSHLFANVFIADFAYGASPSNDLASISITVDTGAVNYDDSIEKVPSISISGISLGIKHFARSSSNPSENYNVAATAAAGEYPVAGGALNASTGAYDGSTSMQSLASLYKEGATVADASVPDTSTWNNYAHLGYGVAIVRSTMNDTLNSSMTYGNSHIFSSMSPIAFNKRITAVSMVNDTLVVEPMGMADASIRFVPDTMTIDGYVQDDFNGMMNNCIDSTAHTIQYKVVAPNGSGVTGSGYGSIKVTSSLLGISEIGSYTATASQEQYYTYLPICKRQSYVNGNDVFNSYFVKVNNQMLTSSSMLAPHYGGVAGDFAMTDASGNELPCDIYDGHKYYTMAPGQTATVTLNIHENAGTASIFTSSIDIMNLTDWTSIVHDYGAGHYAMLHNSSTVKFHCSELGTSFIQEGAAPSKENAFDFSEYDKPGKDIINIDDEIGDGYDGVGTSWRPSTKMVIDLTTGMIIVLPFRMTDYVSNQVASLHPEYAGYVYTGHDRDGMCIDSNMAIINLEYNGDGESGAAIPTDAGTFKFTSSYLKDYYEYPLSILNEE